MQFDLLIKGGEVVDPGGPKQGRLDVGIKRNRIAAVDANIPAASAVRVIDAAGQYVTPGLVDLHTHVYHSVTYWGIHADPVAAASGVTTWLDVGSAGAFNLQGFRDFIAKPAAARLYALLNISSIGLTAATGELANLAYCDTDLCVKLTNLHRDLVLGIKVRVDHNTTGPNGIEPLRRGAEAAERTGLPMMVHIGYGPPTIQEVLPLLRPGDILTHCFTGGNMRIVDERGALLDDAKRAWDRGVIMDIGHGGGSFSFEVGEKLIRAGYKPDVISSDIHQHSVNGPLFDLPTCLSKFMALGMSFAEVIAAATARPAAVLGLQDEIGTLAVGNFADVALFTVEHGAFPLYDVFYQERIGSDLIRNTLTLVNGRELPRVPNPPMTPWMELSEGQADLVRRGLTPDALARRVHA
jgi:dihydroorotase